MVLDSKNMFINPDKLVLDDLVRQFSIKGWQVRYFTDKLETSFYFGRRSTLEKTESFMTLKEEDMEKGKVNNLKFFARADLQEIGASPKENERRFALSGSTTGWEDP